MSRASFGLTTFARAGFTQLSEAARRFDALVLATGAPPDHLLRALSTAADPDAALAALVDLHERTPDEVTSVLCDDDHAARLIRVIGASHAVTDFLLRHPAELAAVRSTPDELPDATEYNAKLTAVATASTITGNPDGEDAAWSALRVQYRRLLLEIVVFDLMAREPLSVIERVGKALADLAGAALDASLLIARRSAAAPADKPASFGQFPAGDVDNTRLAIIGMGKAGASELNYLSDVDVIFVAEPDPGSHLSADRAVEIATRLALLTMRGVSALATEPPLWEVDPNLRPEGKDGALVRTLDSHVHYYERWAKGWEFQALMKARPLAGDLELGARYVAGVAPMVWSSASRENFVESVQRMRERVTDHIPPEDIDRQLKLGPGGLRDIEFTVQLLQLVHGQTDESIRERGTLPALAALAVGGYVGRLEAQEFTQDWRVLRLLEHRVQLRRLRRTHLMPDTEADLRHLARASGLATDAKGVSTLWQSTRKRVRGLHKRLFYRPLLTTAATTPDDVLLTNERASARLAAIGFRDPQGALSHIAALTAGVSRRATIQRHLLPAMLEWFAEGADPDYGLLAFRRLSETLGGTHWYLRMLRDSSGTAIRLTRVLSSSRFAGELLERIPEAVAWLEDDSELRPRPLEALQDEARAILARYPSPDEAARVLRRARRREVLRLAFSSILGLCTVEELGRALSGVTDTLLQGVLNALRREHDDGIEFAVIGMGRLGGQELGFGSDADVLYVYRDGTLSGEAAHRRALDLVAALNRLTEDARLPLELDADLRPEGRNGVIVRSLDAYRAYYERWSLTWEAQALLRARGVAGDARLIDDFTETADDVRYPESIDEQSVREVKRIKARVENERLPQGADPTRHVKLGRGSLSDVEWYVQLLQLEHAARIPDLQTPSTLDALDVAVREGLVVPSDAETLRAAWVFAARARSALTLWLNKTTDVLPVERGQLEGVARIMGYPPHSASELEQDYLAITRRSRATFERGFYGTTERYEPSTG